MTLTWIDGAAAPQAATMTEAYFPIRMLDDERSPVAGVLASRREGGPIVLCDVEAAPDWLWTATPTDHVVGAIDLARRPDGHDLVLPWCEQRLDTWLDDRSRAGQSFGGGEIVTVCVSLLRGVVAAVGRTNGSARSSGTQQAVVADEVPTGTWWLTDQGAPLFAVDRAHTTAVNETAARLIARLRDAADDRVLVRVLDRVIAVLERPRLVRRALPELETALFEACAPKPLEPVSAGDDSTVQSNVFDDARPRRVAQAAGQPSGWAMRAREMTDRYVDARFAEILSDAASWVKLRAQGRRSSRADGYRADDSDAQRSPTKKGGVRKLVIVAVVVGAAVLIGGVLWPTTNETADAEVDAAAAASITDESATDESTRNAQPGSEGPGDQTAAPSPALGGANEGPSAAEPTTPEQIVAAARELLGVPSDAAVRFVEQYGDIAVVSVSSDRANQDRANQDGAEQDGAEQDGAEQFFALERRDDAWHARPDSVLP